MQQRPQLSKVAFQNVAANRSSEAVSSWLVLVGCAFLTLITCGLGCRPKSGVSSEGSPVMDERAESPQVAEFEFEPLTNEEMSSGSKAAPAEKASAKEAQEPTRVLLEEVQGNLGISHIYENGAQGKAMIVETIGGGCGWLDFDRDGRVDLYLNQGGDPAASSIVDQPADALFRQFAESKPAASRFTKVSDQARIDERHYSQGVAIADFDNDGWQDVYVTNLGKNTLWHNCGDGTFMEVATAAGVADPLWSTSAAWADLDRDGDLDLYVCNYCEYDPRNPVVCRDRLGRDTLCNPAELEPVPDRCFVNMGDGTFREQSQRLGLYGPGNRALGVAVADFDNDHWPDIYVANDTTDNFLFVNDGRGSFVDEATIRGCAVDRAGGPQGSMGIAVADYDENEFLDLYVTHFYEESNTLYANQGDRGFRDVTASQGLHEPTLRFLGFGTVFADFDLNGRYELMVANGHVDHSERAADPRMKPQLFAMGMASRRWYSISEQAGDFFQRQMMGRAVAVADFDGDGDPDLAVSNENDAAVVLQNQSLEQPANAGNRWLKLTLVGTESNRQAVGSRIVVSSQHRSQMQEYCGGTSFAASHDVELIFGLGPEASELQVDVRWPSGQEQQWGLTPGGAFVLIEGQSEPVAY